jgi:hypothetical protein
MLANVTQGGQTPCENTLIVIHTYIDIDTLYPLYPLIATLVMGTLCHDHGPYVTE